MQQITLKAVFPAELHILRHLLISQLKPDRNVQRRQSDSLGHTADLETLSPGFGFVLVDDASPLFNLPAENAQAHMLETNHHDGLTKTNATSSHHLAVTATTFFVV
jgi:hypothetical protein